MPTPKKRTKSTSSAIQEQLLSTGIQMTHPERNATSLPSLDTQAKNISNEMRAGNPFCDQDVLQMHAMLVAYTMSFGGKAIVEGITMRNELEQCEDAITELLKALDEEKARCKDVEQGAMQSKHRLTLYLAEVIQERDKAIQERDKAFQERDAAIQELDAQKKQKEVAEGRTCSFQKGSK
jgi:hypothetical protein